MGHGPGRARAAAQLLAEGTVTRFETPPEVWAKSRTRRLRRYCVRVKPPSDRSLTSMGFTTSKPRAIRSGVSACTAELARGDDFISSWLILSAFSVAAVTVRVSMVARSTTS
jgi:hypothetical protein